MKQIADAYIVDAVRTPTGRRRGSLAQIHGADLGAVVLKALVERNGIPDVDYDDVIFGCVDTVGPLAGDIARTCWLAAGLSDEVPGTTIVIAGGVQTMSAIPISSAMLAGQPLGFNDPFSGSDGWVSRYGDGLVTQFRSAQMIADKWQLSREAMEVFSLASHRRARTATDAGYFDREILPYQGLTADETIRDTSLEAMAQLQPLQEGGSITAAATT